MNLIFKGIIFFGTAILMFSAYLPAFAGQTLKNQSETPEALETIIVTAQKQEENIQDVSMGITAFTAQGTLYGKNTEAGVINIITRQPDNNFRGRLSANIGTWLASENDDRVTQTYSISLGGPIQTDKLFAGIAGKFCFLHCPRNCA